MRINRALALPLISGLLVIAGTAVRAAEEHSWEFRSPRGPGALEIRNGQFVPLPDEEAAPVTARSSEVFLNIDEQGRYSVAGKVRTLDEVGTLMRQAAVNDPKVIVLLRVDRRCKWEVVVAAMEACSKAKIKTYRVTALQPDGRDKSQPPNVLLILVDDLGYGDLSCYGAKDLETPNIDRLAAAGMKWTQFYANSPVCSPTRAALLSGRYPDAVGVPGVIRTHASNSWGYLSADAVLLPAVLKRAGYRTAMVGKWHLGLDKPNLPNLRGFDFFHGFLGDMMDDYYTHRRHGNNYMRRNAETIDPPGHATDMFTDWACKWLKGDCPDFRPSEGDCPNFRPSENGTVPLKRREGDSPVFAETKTGTVPETKTGTVPAQPFFLYLAYNAPHDPIQPPPEWLAKYKARHPEATEKRAKLAALIEHLDDGVGRVLAALKETGQAENTLVIFVSDNGGAPGVGANNGPLNNGKGTMLEGGIRVPMCAAWPGHIRPGSTSDRVALTMDLFATICEAGDCPDFRGHHAQHGRETGTVPFDGRSILPTLLGKPQPAEDRTFFWVRLEGGGRYAGGVPFYAARRGDWKLLQNFPKEPLRLYNLKDDPGEKTDLAAQQPQVYAELKKALDEHTARCQRVPYRPPGGIGPGEIGKEQGKTR